MGKVWAQINTIKHPTPNGRRVMDYIYYLYILKYIHFLENSKYSIDEPLVGLV